MLLIPDEFLGAAGAQTMDPEILLIRMEALPAAGWIVACVLLMQIRRLGVFVLLGTLGVELLIMLGGFDGMRTCCLLIPYLITFVLLGSSTSSAKDLR